MTDAIVMSGWSWGAANVPERIALALSQLGAKILYCENPTSLLRTTAPEMREIQPGIFRFIPQFFGHRLNRLNLGLDRLQARLVAAQVQEAATRLKLDHPLFIYPHGDFFAPLCREFKKRGFPLVHCCFDYPERGQIRHIELSDRTLTVSKSVFHQLRANYGTKVALVPQVRWFKVPELGKSGCATPNELAFIPKPRLGYLGLVSNRLNFRILHELLVAQSDWHFIHFGDSKCLPLPNVHTVPWRDASDLDGLVSALDVGFMPYDCHNDKDFHCLPLKLFDYFNAGIPVVSTSIVNLWDYSDIIYFGDTAEELATAIENALDEPPDSPRKSRRKRIAAQHSTGALAEALSTLFSMRTSARIH